MTPDDRPLDELTERSPIIQKPGAPRHLIPKRLRGSNEHLRHVVGRAPALEHLLVGVELLVISVWSLLFVRPYLNLDPAMAPTGREFLGAIQLHHIWIQLRQCGACAMWYGNVAGGLPGFAEPTGSVLHPLVILTTLGWGVLNGAKLALAGGFLLAGLAQWWLGRVLRVGRVARVWSAAMAVVGGHLAARMDLGVLPLILATGACTFVLPPLITLNRTGRRRNAVLLGVALALVVVAGNGYLQVALALSLPAALFLLPWERAQIVVLMRRYALALILAFLLAAPFLVPFLHFLPEFAKDNDPAFKSAQRLGFIPLNLVINDLDYYHSDVLGKLPYASHNADFIGWTAVLLALWAIRGGRNRAEQRAIAFLAAFAFLALWAASAGPLILLVRLIPIPAWVYLISGVRYTPFMAGLAVPAILGLSAIGLDQLLGLRWARLLVAVHSGEDAIPSIHLDLRWLLAIPLGLALASVWSFSRQFISMVPIGSDVTDVIAALHTPDLQWVNVPFGEHIYITPAVEQGLKLAVNFYMTWHWAEHQPPQPVLEAHRGTPLSGMTRIGKAGGVDLYASGPGHEYASMTSVGGSRTVCTAHGIGGDIDVTCPEAQAGILSVEENSWSGWHAWVDGHPAQLQAAQWLTLPLPAGKHTIQFRYRPWDVPLGLLGALIGLLLAVYYWRRDEVSSS